MSIVVKSTNMPETKEKPKLTVKQQAFICAYLQCFNAAKAARQAGYSPESAKEVGCENLTKPYIAAEIHRRLDAEGITPARIKIAYAEIAFDTDAADFEGWLGSGNGTTLKDLRDEGFNTKLVKSISITAKGCKLEMYSRKDALDSLARVSGMVTDKVEHSGRIDSAISREKFEDMNDENRARLLRTAGVADVPGADDGEDPGPVDTGGG